VATWAQVSKAALALPLVEEKGHEWRVKGKLLAWERPLRPTDLREVGDQGVVLGFRTDGIDAKEAFLLEEPEACFATSHFNGYPAVLVRLAKLRAPLLRELMTEAWLVQAPKTAVKAYLADHPR
jgi:hypothetical protein